MTATVYGYGIQKTVTLAPETTYGVQGAGPGQDIRRTNLTMDLSRATIESNEITEDAQLNFAAQGPQTLTGQLAGILSPGTYKSILSGVTRGAWSAGVTLSGLTDTTVTVNGTTGVVTIAGPAENFLTTGFKAGDVIRLSGLTGGPATMNGANLRLTAVLANSMTAGPCASAVAYASGQSAVGIAVVGKKLLMPLRSAQTWQSFSMETWQNDISESELGLGLRFTSAAINAPASGYATMQASFTGRDKITSGAQVYSSPTAQSVSPGVMAVNGKISYQGADLAYLTAFNLNMTVQAQPTTVVGDLRPADIVLGMMNARGTMTALLTSDTLTNDFLNQNEVTLSLLLPNSGAAGADFVSLYMSRVRLFSNTRQDSDRAIMRSFNWTALRQLNGGTGTEYDSTTIAMQDSLA